MQDQPISDPAARMAKEDGAILALLSSDESHRPWAVQEIGRELRIDPADGLQRLYGAGLVHRLDDFVWPTRAAVVAKELHS